jgi:PAS domain S-box-containing protein
MNYKFSDLIEVQGAEGSMRKQSSLSFGPVEVTAGMLSMIGLYVVSRYSYLAFHTLVELFSIVIGFGLFMLAWNSRRIINNNYLLFIGIAYVFVSGVDLIHTLAYKEIDIFQNRYGTGLTTQFWIAARYVESLALFAAPFWVRRKLRPQWTLVGFATLTGFLLASIFLRVFPVCYVEGVGLTRFKIVSEYVISSTLGCSLILLLRKQSEFDREVLTLLVLSIITTICSELLFTFYVRYQDLSNVAGHFLKVVSFYFIYKALIEVGLSKPYSLFLKNLKQHEEDLRESQKQMNRAQEIAHLGSWDLDLLNNHLSWSDEVYRIFGLQPQEFGATYEAFLEAVHPEDREAVDAAYSGSLHEGRDAYEIEHRVVQRSTGEIRIVHEKCEHFRDKTGRAVKSVGMVHDITEQKAAEQALREARDDLEQRVKERTAELRSLIEASLDPFVTINRDGKISAVNAAAELVTGFSRRELIGTEFSDYFTEPEKARAGYQKVFNQGFVRDYELEICSRNGEITPVLYNASVYRDHTGSVIGVFAAARDIAKQKRAEEARSRLAATVESSDDAIISEDLDGMITSWNQGAERLYGYSAAEALGRPVSILVPPDQQDQPAVLLRRIREGIRVEHFETERVRKDGRTIPVSLTLSPTRNRQGEINGASAIVRDITERKQAQEALQKVLAELEVRVKERTKELSETNQSLQAANKELESFSYSVSHDLRAPLRAIDGFSRMVLKHYADKLDDEGRRKLNVIRSNTQKMDELINDLLTFSRLGRKEMVNASVNMEALVRSAWGELSLANPERSIQFSMNKLPHAMGDQTLIKQVVVNLLSNAIKFSKSRELAIVEVGAYPEEERNVYYVRDNGVGFDMQYYDKLFGVFQRLHSADEFEGTGVGLAIVERIIRRHGGKVWAEGKVGEGATFYFTLSRSDAYRLLKNGQMQGARNRKE